MQVPAQIVFGDCWVSGVLFTLFFSFRDMQSDLFFSGWKSYRKEFIWVRLLSPARAAPLPSPLTLGCDYSLQAEAL